MRSDLEGAQAETIGAKAYVHPFSRQANHQVEWRATRHILAVAPDGTAEIEETLNGFNDKSGTSAPAGEETRKLADALDAMATRWAGAGARTLHYRETSGGEIRALAPEGVPQLDEASPPLLTLWLLRALRPAATLPSRPVVFGTRWQEPRVVRFDGWNDVKAFESGEWLEVAGASVAPEPAAQLLIVQQILGAVVAGSEKPPEGNATARFHAESVSTVSLSDGRLLAARRTATREITWVLAPVEGLDKPLEFHVRLSAQVEIEECHGPCRSSNLGRSALRGRQ